MNKGIIIGYSASDFHLAKGCLASVKYFMPDIPVCLLHDGLINREEILNVYPDVIFLGKEDIKNDFLRLNSFGWGITKMIAFWESPFENFLFLDADTVMWDNLDEWNLLKSIDMVIDQPQYTFSEEAINMFFFDTQRLTKFDPDFTYSQFTDRYFCTGVFFAKRGIFEIEWYKELLNICKAEQEAIFKYGEMGMLNYMIFKKLQEGKLNIINKRIQFIAPDFSIEQTKKQFPFIDDQPFIEKPMVIHYNGNRKPWIKNLLSYSKPMTWFRVRFYKKSKPELSRNEIIKLLLTEDQPALKKQTAMQWPNNTLLKIVVYGTGCIKS